MLKFSKLSVTFFFGVLSWSERDELQANPEATLVASATEEDVSQYNQLQQLGNVAPQMPSHAIEDLLSIGALSLWAKDALKICITKPLETLPDRKASSGGFRIRLTYSHPKAQTAMIIPSKETRTVAR